MLRDYQERAVIAGIEHLDAHRSTLIVSPTGTGKTVMAVELIRRLGCLGRTLWIAHRDELLGQAEGKIKEVGLTAEREQAGERASDSCDVVVASIQSLSPARLAKRFGENRFSLIVIDEAHHAPAKGYRRLLDYYPGSNVIGFTATPDRLDEKPLGTVFETCAFEYGIREAIDDGWLCDIEGMKVDVKDLDISKVRSSFGDLREDDLEIALTDEKSVQGIASATIERSEDRQTIVFTSGVKSAHMLADILNRHRKGSTVAVDGGMKKEDRKRIIAEYREGKYQYICNCSLLTEGFDCPRVACVVMARMTKSRALYSQQIGRGTRVHPGKDNLLVLDINAGNLGRHKLITAADILGLNKALVVGEQPKRKKKIILELNPPDKRSRAVVSANYSTRSVDPISGMRTTIKLIGILNKYGYTHLANRCEKIRRKFYCDDDEGQG